MANFSMHYFSGEVGLSADYYGLFCEGLKARLSHGKDHGTPPFVGVMSHGCSGDIWRRDYALPPDQQPDWTIDEYSKQLVDLADSALESIEYRHDVRMPQLRGRFGLTNKPLPRPRLLKRTRPRHFQSNFTLQLWIVRLVNRAISAHTDPLEYLKAAETPYFGFCGFRRLFGVGLFRRFLWLV